MPTIPPYARHLLTTREIEIVQLLPAGPTAIARSLFITVDCVRRHLLHIRRKLNIPTKAQLDELAPQILAADQPLNLEVNLSCPVCRAPIRLTVNRMRRLPRRRPKPDPL